MALPYIDTPRTEIDGNATYLTNGPRSSTRHNLSALSVENSFQAPDKDRNLLNEFENARSKKQGGLSLRTPRAGVGSRSKRNTLQDRQNAPAASGTEFTPLMKSVTKNNAHRTVDRRAGNGETPGPASALSNIDETDMYEDGSVDEDNNATPVPQVASSSVQSTPLPVLPGRSNNTVVSDGQNVMTLKEQENMINKLDKENFGLKLKVHYLEEALEKRGPEFNRAALNENTELKVTTVTLHRDLSRYKKSLIRAERDLVTCQQQVQELREKAKSKGADDALQKELDWMREQIEDKDSRINELEDELKSSGSKESDEISNLREEIANLEFTIREKDRLLDDKDEEFQESLDQAKTEAEEAKAASEGALAEKEQAVEDLRELQDEMANKSFNTNGLSRQLEEKADRLEEELAHLQEQHAALQEDLDDKSDQERGLIERIEELKQDSSSERETLQGDIELAQHERDIARRESERLLSRLHEAEDELRTKGDHKSLLQQRHDALTGESKGLQSELDSARASIADLEQQISAEREELQARHRAENDRLNNDIASLHREISDKESQYRADRDKWEGSRRSLEAQRDQIEQQAAGHKSTVERLQSLESNISGTESKLQQLLEGERERHAQEEEFFKRQIKELNDEISSRRSAHETQRHELLSVKEELRTSKREGDDLKEKVQSLEDEVVVLQESMEEQQKYANAQRRSGSPDRGEKLQNAMREKQTLRDQLANANVELNDMRSSLSDIKAERDELRSQLSLVENQVDDAHRLDQEKLELRKAKLRLESETNRLSEEKKYLLEAKNTLQNELHSEVERATTEENRLSAEINTLQDKLSLGSEKRDRQLVSSKRTIERLESRTKELEGLIEHQLPPDIDTATGTSDLSVLRHSLELARKKEKALQHRESDLKTAVKEFKAQVTHLEKENYDLQTKRLDSTSPKSSTSAKLEVEIRSLREQLLDAHKSMKSLRSKNNELQRSLVDENERKDLHELLKSSTLEAESLALKVSERDARVTQLRSHLRRVRDERALSMKKADGANRELETLQGRYETLLEDMENRPERSSRHEKEIRGLGKEIMWLRARLTREEMFRKDLAWSKGLMELGERVRVACNETDLKMIAEMGVDATVQKTKLEPKRKFKAVAVAAMVVARMRKLASDWRKEKKQGEGLGRAKREVLKRRESGKRLHQLDT